MSGLVVCIHQEKMKWKKLFLMLSLNSIMRFDVNTLRQMLHLETRAGTWLGHQAVEIRLFPVKVARCLGWWLMKYGLEMDVG